jgi:hypothetical protein
LQTENPGGYHVHQAEQNVGFTMAITAPSLKQLIAQELETVADERIQDYVRSLLVEPEAILRSAVRRKSLESIPKQPRTSA